MTRRNWFTGMAVLLMGSMILGGCENTTEKKPQGASQEESQKESEVLQETQTKTQEEESGKQEETQQETQKEESGKQEGTGSTATEPEKAADELKEQVVFLNEGSEVSLLGKKLTLQIQGDNTNEGGPLALIWGDQGIVLTEECEYIWDDSSCLVVARDHSIWVLALAGYSNDYGETYLVRLNEDGTMEASDKISASLASKDSVTSESVVLSTRFDVLGTYSGTKKYTFTEGKFVTQDKIYDLSNHEGDYSEIYEDTSNLGEETLHFIEAIYAKNGRRCLKLKKNLKVQGPAGEIQLKKGELIYPTGCDTDEKVFYFEADQNGLIQCHVSYTETGWTEQGHTYIDGVGENEIFEVLPYAG